MMLNCPVSLGSPSRYMINWAKYHKPTDLRLARVQTPALRQPKPQKNSPSKPKSDWRKQKAPFPIKTYAKVKEQLNQIAQIYAGSVFAEHAVAQKKVLLNAKADELEARARAAEDAKRLYKSLPAL